MVIGLAWVHLSHTLKSDITKETKANKEEGMITVLPMLYHDTNVKTRTCIDFVEKSPKLYGTGAL